MIEVIKFTSKPWKFLSQRNPPIQSKYDLTGKKFGLLTVINFYGKGKYKALRWNCLCECGKTCIALGKDLRAGKDSCNCLFKIKIGKATRTHGMRNTREYKIWAAMKARCLNKNNYSFYRYGGRGIKICERWLRFENFYSDMKQSPTGYSLERINNDGNYEPSNCKWIPRNEQAKNRSISIKIDLKKISIQRGITYKHAWTLYRAGKLV